jgi:hypothetical protein
MKFPFKTPVSLEPGGVGYKAFLVAADSELICGISDATDEEAQAIVNAINQAAIQETYVQHLRERRESLQRGNENLTRLVNEQQAKLDRYEAFVRHVHGFIEELPIPEGWTPDVYALKADTDYLYKWGQP